MQSPFSLKIIPKIVYDVPMLLNSLTSLPPATSPTRVIVRANFDVPIKSGQVADDTRLLHLIPTLKTLIHKQYQLLLLGHLGRPESQLQTDYSLQPVASFLSSYLAQPITLVPYQSTYSQLSLPADQSLVMLENLRFWPEEENKNETFAHWLASLGKIYVNEAFANCHRDHTSMTLLPTLLPHYAGLDLIKEVNTLTQAVESPQRPLVIVIGGAKLETKLPLVSRFSTSADSVLVGGKIAAELANQNQNQSNKIILATLTPDGTDISPASAHTFAQIIFKAGTVIWNGTMGIFEQPASQSGTTAIARAINQTSAYTIIGGGDTEAALTTLNLLDGIDFVCTGGGAMLEYLSTGKLVALESLNQ